MIEIITRDGCIYCTKAKELLEGKDIQYTELHLGLDIKREEVKERWPEQTHLPVVLINNELIGGYVELLDHLNPPLNTEELETMNGE